MELVTRRPNIVTGFDEQTTGSRELVPRRRGAIVAESEKTVTGSPSEAFDRK